MTPIPAMTLVALAGFLGLWGDEAPDVATPELVEIPSGTVAFRPFGNFSHADKTRTPAARAVEVAGFEIMKYQVSRADWRACVAAGGCDGERARDGALPQTHVNFHDAQAYAAWLSQATGDTWRLPTEEEWQRAAAERYGDATPRGTDALDPGERMLEQYERGTLLRDGTSAALRPAGGFGTNSMGVADIAGSVWEWTSGCMETGTLDASGRVIDSTPYCTVRMAGGRHRAGIIDFIRDPQVGGCAVGLPPDYLGFRLVRER